VVAGRAPPVAAFGEAAGGNGESGWYSIRTHACYPWTMTAVSLAHDLGTTDRTLRRLAGVGAIGPGSAGGGLRKTLSREESYLRTHWDLLRGLREALRTEPRVVAALLFGSTARGDDTPSSDVDLVVALDGDPTLRDLHQLSTRVSRKVGRVVDLFYLDDLLAEPDRLGPIVDEGRPVVDRALVWPRMRLQSRKWSRSRAKAARARPGRLTPRHAPA
jgi:predicted nucleotidyltransferase